MQPEIRVSEFMNSKKSYEVSIRRYLVKSLNTFSIWCTGPITLNINTCIFNKQVQTMSHLVASLYKACDATCCVEAGGGRGHLLAALALGHGVPSLTVDCDPAAVKTASQRVRLIQVIKM